MYYDGTKLLSLKDINGNTPEIYICSSNRSAGKTTWFNRWFVKRFLEHDEKFMILYRFDYELSDIANKFFKEIKQLFYPEYNMTSKAMSKGAYHNLFINEKHCGYAVSINKADTVKKLSHLFADTCRMLFDEFQSESNHYCNNEIVKFQSIHTSVARGGGEQVRYVPVYMLANNVSLLNPYYVALNVSSRLNNAKFVRGDGFVIEQGFNEVVSHKQKDTAFNRAFSESSYVKYSTENVYLNDNLSFIEKPAGKSLYLVTLKYDGVQYGIREYADAGIIYCDKNYDASFKYKITVDTADHDINYIMLKRNDLLLSSLRWYFEKGAFRFKDLQCKEAVLKALAFY